MIGIILAVLTLFALYIIFSAFNDSITQQHLDMDRTLHNSLRRAEQLAYIWFYEIKPEVYPTPELISFKTPVGEYFNELPIMDIPIVLPLTGRPVTGLDEVGSKRVKYDYKKVIRPNYLKKYHTSDDLFFKFRCMINRDETQLLRKKIYEKTNFNLWSNTPGWTKLIEHMDRFGNAWRN